MKDGIYSPRQSILNQIIIHFPKIFNTTELAKIDVILGWNNDSWYIPPANSTIKPLYSYYTKVKKGMTANATLIPSTTVTPPPSRIVKEGINLVGPAPSWNSTSLDFDTMLVNQAFVSIEAVGNLTGYTIIISPGLNQPGWAYMKGGPTKEVLPFKGYWLIMDNGPDTLYGFSTTPIPMKY